MINHGNFYTGDTSYMLQLQVHTISYDDNVPASSSSGIFLCINLS